MGDNNCKQCGIGTSGYGYDGLYDGFCPDCISKQRDALLAACEHVVAVVELLSNERTDGLYGLYRLGAPTMRRLQAAIANAKGGA